MKIKLLTTTWSHNEKFEIEKTTLFKSFKKFNPELEIFHHHFNRGHFWKEESEFAEKYGRESEYLLYKIYLWRDIVRELDTDYIIFADANDVVCLSSVTSLIYEFDLGNFIIVGHEKNQWPTPQTKKTWQNYIDYNIYDSQEKKFLNSGMILAKKEKYVGMLDSMVNNVMSKQIKNFTNDQGVFTYYYNTGVFPKIKLDYSNKFVVNTFSRSCDEYYLENGRLISKKNSTSPVFIHDNGWNHGSPRFVNHFELKRYFVDSYATIKNNSKKTDVINPKHKEYLLKLRDVDNFNPSVIYDVGACVNHWNAIAKEVWPNARYVLFEAMEESEDLFLESNDYYEIGVLSDVDNKEVTFYKNVDWPGGNSYYMENPEYSSMANQLFGNPSNQFTRKTKTLNSVVKRRGFPLPELLKIDVQGCEVDILRGSSEILKNVKHLIVELQHVQYNIGASLMNESIPIIESMGFELVTPRFSDSSHADADYHFKKI
jgi:FkbM family methyltransferase